MRIFFSIIIAMSVCCQGAFAAAYANKAKNTKEDSKQKMEQLRQLLSRAAQGDSAAPASGGPEDAKLNQGAVVGNKPTRAPYDGLVSAPSAVVQSDVQEKTGNAAVGGDSATGAVVEPPKPNLYDEAFSGVINQLVPMTPKQIGKLREVLTESQLAAATPPGVPPKPTSTSLLVSLSPQATAPIIRLGAGYITSLVFVDATGQPWPIAAYSIGDPTSFNIQWDRKGNTLLIQSATFYKRSNMAVILRDLNTPVMITLISGQEAVDYRVDLRVPGIGPNAVYTQNGIPESANPVLLDVLNGIAPKGSKELKIRGGDAKAWLLKNKLYLRTNLNVISPGWQSTMSSIDGTRAYQMQPAPVILALQNGRDKILTLMLEGLE